VLNFSLRSRWSKPADGRHAIEGCELQPARFAPTQIMRSFGTSISYSEVAPDIEYQ